MSRKPLHIRMENFWGADVRLFYGIGVPLLVLLGLIIVFALHATWWLLAGLVVCLLLLTGVVLVGFLQMLGEDDEDGRPRSGRRQP